MEGERQMTSHRIEIDKPCKIPATEHDFGGRDAITALTDATWYVEQRESKLPQTVLAIAYSLHLVLCTGSAISLVPVERQVGR